MWETSGVLRRAVGRFLNHATRAEDLETLRWYFAYWANAPCWRTRGDEELWAALRADIAKPMDADQLRAWLCRALEVGLDPL